MPIYKLEPIEDAAHHDAWRASGLGPMVVWVRANDPDDARQKLQLATVVSMEGYEVEKLLPHSPWLNSLVVSCDEDDTQDVPAGMALLGNGKTITL
jgi:hypothetical protein